MFYMHSAGWGWGWWLLMSVGMVAFWALVIYGIVWLVRGRPVDRFEEDQRESPDEILKRRLAQGELSIDEYQRLLAAIHGDAASSAPSDDRETTGAVR